MPAHSSEATAFRPLPPDPEGCVSWIHPGDLHMERAGEQNEIDLGRIVDVINDFNAQHGVSFVYLPDDVRSHLDRLLLPWCGVVGHHDVHEKGFDHFRSYIAKDLTSAFTPGTQLGPNENGRKWLT